MVPGLIKNKNAQIFAFFNEFVNLKIILNNNKQLPKHKILEVKKPLNIYGMNSSLNGRINFSVWANPLISQGNNGKNAKILSFI